MSEQIKRYRIKGVRAIQYFEHEYGTPEFYEMESLIQSFAGWCSEIDAPYITDGHYGAPRHLSGFTVYNGKTCSYCGIDSGDWVVENGPGDYIVMDAHDFTNYYEEQP